MIQYLPRYVGTTRPIERRSVEFVIAATVHDVPDTDEQNADEVAEKLQAELEQRIAAWLNIPMQSTPSGPAGVGYAAPQVYVGVRYT